MPRWKLVLHCPEPEDYQRLLHEISAFRAEKTMQRLERHSFTELQWRELLRK